MSGGKYRAVPTSLWTAVAFRDLGPMPPSAPALLLYLLTGPETSMVPGVVAAGPAALAEGLGWSVKDTRAQLAALERRGLVRVDAARLLWVPSALTERPANPNVATGWAKALADAPECALRDEIARAVFRLIAPHGDERFTKPFVERFGERLKEPSRNQEQEQKQNQEQEQEQDQRDAASAAALSEGRSLDGPTKARASSRAPRTFMTPDWQPRPEDAKPLADVRLDVGAVLADFRDYWLAQGKQMADWNACFRQNTRKVLATDWLRSRYLRPTPVDPPASSGRVVGQAAPDAVPAPPGLAERMRAWSRGETSELDGEGLGGGS